MSKFIGKSFNGWNVVAEVNADKKHKYFFLVESKAKKTSVPGMIIVRDNDMTALESNEKSIEDILEAKEKTRAKKPTDFFAQEFMLYSDLEIKNVK